VSDSNKLTRRALFGLGHGAGAPKRDGFSLDRFYAERSAAGPAPAPEVKLREGLEPVETSHIGVPELSEAAVPKTATPIAGVVNVDGIVRIVNSRCLAWQKSFCSVCSERCPEQGAILVEEGRPRVVAEACTGCGICVTLCPAPINAFEVVTRE
jgi:Pyruvate/2-oxoacid:ferredoxin oxidoreductase delta subunit